MVTQVMTLESSWKRTTPVSWVSFLLTYFILTRFETVQHWLMALVEIEHSDWIHWTFLVLYFERVKRSFIKKRFKPINCQNWFSSRCNKLNRVQFEVIDRFWCWEWIEREIFFSTGSSTFCCLALDRNQRLLRSLNIGDSGFIVYRNHQIYRRSECTNDPFSGAPRQLFALDDSNGLPVIRNELWTMQMKNDCHAKDVQRYFI